MFSVTHCTASFVCWLAVLNNNWKSLIMIAAGCSIKIRCITYMEVKRQVGEINERLCQYYGTFLVSRSSLDLIRS